MQHQRTPDTLTFTRSYKDNDGLPAVHIWQFRIELDGQLGIMFQDQYGAFGTALPKEARPIIQEFLQENGQTT